MDATHSSDNESLRGEMSYLYGRDPSILAYGQRPFPSQESKKNLISLLEEGNEDDESIESIDKASTISNTSVVQTLKVFLRMKPMPKKMKLIQEQSEAYSVLNSTTLATKMRSLDSNASCLKKLKTNEVICRKFTFTQTFGPETTQLELFEQSVKPQMIDFLAGKNSVVMSYGTTNSGKTYTLQGTTESPGLIPRGIEFVFTNINTRSLPCFKPVNSNDIMYLSNNERLQEMDFKMKLLSFNTADDNYHITAYDQMQQLLRAESPMKPKYNPNAHYSVWISFAEIYNETIYDLLWVDQRKRPALRLATDNKGRAFIKGLSSVCVNSGAEAYQVLMAGKYNLKVAATALNSRSSRSHCIFTIKLLKYRSEHDAQSVEMSSFVFCDLAGSERLKKTLNVGERLKEAQNINTSLLVLGRCLKQIHESQTSVRQKNESIGPFRESKLTRLFQRALSGKEQLALIVNVNPVPNLYEETQNVLNFSAIAKKIVVEHVDIKRRRSSSRFSRLVSQNMKGDMDWENTDLDGNSETCNDASDQESDIEENDQEAYEDLMNENEMLKKEIKELKASTLTRDMQTRQELTEMYTEIMKKLEADYKNRMLDLEEQQEDLRNSAVDQIESFYKEKLKKLRIRKQSQSGDDESMEESSIIEDLEMENTRLAAKLETMKKTIRDLKHTNEAIENEKTKMSLDLVVSKDEVKRTKEMLDAAQRSIYDESGASVTYMKELNEIIKKKDERIKIMKDFLNEAKEEYISITEQAQKLENKIKHKNEIIAEQAEHIQDLQEQVIQANAYSSEQSKVIENLEEELDLKLKSIIQLEEKLRILIEKQSSKSEKDELNMKSDNLICTIESGIQTENLIILSTSEEIETANISCQVSRSITDISCQTSESHCYPVQTNEIGLQTSLSLNHIVAEEDVNVKTEIVEIVDIDTFNKLQFQYDEMKEILETCRYEKVEAQKQFEESIEGLQKQIDVLIIQEQTKETEIIKLRKELEEALEKSERETSDLKLLVDTQNNKAKNLMDQLSETQIREQDKDTEISGLQKEIKILIQANEEVVKKMETEMKVVLRDYTSMKDQLIKSEERNRKEDKDYKQVIQILEKKLGSLEKEISEKYTENTSLKVRIDELSRKLNQTEHEMEVFTRNRDEMVSKYEALVSLHFQESERLKKEVIRLQDLLQEVKENTRYVASYKGSSKKTRVRGGGKEKLKPREDVIENTSEEEHLEEKPKLKKEFLTPAKDNIPFTDYSDSETKRSAKSANKDAAPRSTRTRKKRLFTPLDESFVDVEQGEPSPSPRSTSTRSLRNRRR